MQRQPEQLAAGVGLLAQSGLVGLEIILIDLVDDFFIVQTERGSDAQAVIGHDQHRQSIIPTCQQLRVFTQAAFVQIFEFGHRDHIGRQQIPAQQRIQAVAGFAFYRQVGLREAALRRQQDIQDGSVKDRFLRDRNRRFVNFTNLAGKRQVFYAGSGKGKGFWGDYVDV